MRSFLKNSCLYFFFVCLLAPNPALAQNESNDNGYSDNEYSNDDDDFDLDDDGLGREGDEDLLTDDFGGGSGNTDDSGQQNDNLLGGDDDLDFDSQANPPSNNQYPANTTANQSGTNGFGANNGNTPVQNNGDQGTYTNSEVGNAGYSEDPVQTTGEYSESVEEAKVVVTPNSFSGVEPVADTMRVMADGEAPQEYIVEEGDTLFDICDQLLSEGGYWPKLWALNPFIKNPHFIWPGMRLRFYPGDEENPPFLQIVNEEDVVPVDTEEIQANDLLYGRVPSIDKFFSVSGTEVIDEETLDSFQFGESVSVEGNIFNATGLDVTLPGFIFSEEVEPLGEVMGGNGGEYLTGVGKRMLVEMESPLSAGQVYTVVRYQEEVENLVLGDDIGYKYQFVGNVKVVRVFAEEDMAEVVALDGFDASFPGDYLIPVTTTNRRVSLMDTEFQASKTEAASIVGFEMLGVGTAADNEMVFIDRGSSDGVSVGQSFDVYQLPDEFILDEIDEDTEGLRYRVGQIKIIDTTDVGSVGYVISGSGEIRIGDRVGKG